MFNNISFLRTVKLKTGMNSVSRKSFCAQKLYFTQKFRFAKVKMSLGNCRAPYVFFVAHQMYIKKFKLCPCAISVDRKYALKKGLYMINFEGPLGVQNLFCGPLGVQN